MSSLSGRAIVLSNYTARASGQTVVSNRNRNRGTRAMLSKRVLGLPASSLLSPGRCRWLIWILLLCGAVGSAVGQPYKSDPIDKAARAYSANAKQWLTNPAAYTADKQHFDDYFIKYYFPDMTHAEDADLGRIGDSRYNLFKKFLWATTNVQLQQDLTNMAYVKMGPLVVDPG